MNAVIGRVPSPGKHAIESVTPCCVCYEMKSHNIVHIPLDQPGSPIKVHGVCHACFENIQKTHSPQCPSCRAYYVIKEEKVQFEGGQDTYVIDVQKEPLERQGEPEPNPGRNIALRGAANEFARIFGAIGESSSFGARFGTFMLRR
ncbi:MAG: hypothetical protein K1X28_08740 [Parachlamydiales bacterium]|nr:hypothetical protein [Parachlamydiales bacterium]